MASLYDNRYNSLQFEIHKVFVSYHHANDQRDRECDRGWFFVTFCRIIGTDTYLS